MLLKFEPASWLLVQGSFHYTKARSSEACLFEEPPPPILLTISLYSTPSLSGKARGTCILAWIREASDSSRGHCLPLAQTWLLSRHLFPGQVLDSTELLLCFLWNSHLQPCPQLPLSCFLCWCTVLGYCCLIVLWNIIAIHPFTPGLYLCQNIYFCCSPPPPIPFFPGECYFSLLFPPFPVYKMPPSLIIPSTFLFFQLSLWQPSVGMDWINIGRGLGLEPGLCFLSPSSSVGPWAVISMSVNVRSLVSWERKEIKCVWLKELLFLFSERPSEAASFPETTQVLSTFD